MGSWAEIHVGIIIKDLQIQPNTSQGCCNTSYQYPILLLNQNTYPSLIGFKNKRIINMSVPPEENSRSPHDAYQKGRYVDEITGMAEPQKLTFLNSSVCDDNRIVQWLDTPSVTHSEDDRNGKSGND